MHTADHSALLLPVPFVVIRRHAKRWGGSWAAHLSRLDRLATDRRRADTAGWTDVRLRWNRGQFRLFGMPPGATALIAVPDTWL